MSRRVSYVSNIGFITNIAFKKISFSLKNLAYNYWE